jgi:hypothetical protein
MVGVGDSKALCLVELNVLTQEIKAFLNGSVYRFTNPLVDRVVGPEREE